MFKLYSGYFKNGKGNHWITLLYFLIVSAIITPFAFIPYIGYLFDKQSSIRQLDVDKQPLNETFNSFNEPSSFGILFFIIVNIFIIIPLILGILHIFKNTDLGMRPKFKDLFIIFKKGAYFKTMKLSILMIIIVCFFYFLLAIIIFIIMLIVFILAWYFAFYLESLNNAISMLFVVFPILFFITSFIISVPFYYVVIFMINTSLVHIDQHSLPTLTKVSIGRKITKKGPRNPWVLLISHYLFGILICGVIFTIYIDIMMNHNIFTYIIKFIILGGLFYFIFGSYVNFYHQNKNAIYPTETPATDE
ncbi:hypothetical protein [Mammaliicoccus sp. Dog046]|uniref:hypothetical protein n=1 Tax=Mammaliicoccus sp. Dog046 TaxID=3034233 RepID=UPI002B25C524|nr:hypothetical protein [Mammaliicoccus sp. Dog046]WQK85869.1 hypothetical protein P3U32_02230 [Mammaliicoccus sp. Dog046]